VPPARDIDSPLRLPVSNMYRGNPSGIMVSGRLCGGVVQVGERVRILPGEESAVVKCKLRCEMIRFFTHVTVLAIELEDDAVPWAAAGSSVQIQLVSVDTVHLGIGSVLCPVNDVVPLATVFTARIIVFEIEFPITAGVSVGLLLSNLSFDHQQMGLD
jgi:elongation factor 1 alpha-like protein